MCVLKYGIAQKSMNGIHTQIFFSTWIWPNQMLTFLVWIAPISDSTSESAQPYKWVALLLILCFYLINTLMERMWQADIHRYWLQDDSKEGRMWWKYCNLLLMGIYLLKAQKGTFYLTTKRLLYYSNIKRYRIQVFSLCINDHPWADHSRAETTHSFLIDPIQIL